MRTKTTTSKSAAARNPEFIVARRSLSEQGVEKIRAAILSGAFEPGQRMTEENIAERFGLSRSTIRGCMMRLVHEGLIIQEPYQGYSVRSLSSHDAWEIFTLRNALEAFAAKVLAESMTPAKKRTLETAYQAVLKAVRDGKRTAAVEADFRLHETIAALGEHSALQQHYHLIAAKVRLYQNLVSKFLSLEDYVATHQPLIDALVAGDSALAQQVASEHNTNDGHQLVAWLKKREEAADQAHKGLAA